MYAHETNLRPENSQGTSTIQLALGDPCRKLAITYAPPPLSFMWAASLLPSESLYINSISISSATTCHQSRKALPGAGECKRQHFSKELVWNSFPRALLRSDSKEKCVSTVYLAIVPAAQRLDLCFRLSVTRNARLITAAVQMCNVLLATTLACFLF